MKIIINSPKNKTIYNFRGDLIKGLVNQGHEVVAIGPNKENVEKVLELGARFIEVPLQKDKTSIFHDLKYFKNLMKVFKEEKPDMVFSYTVKPVIFGGIAAKMTGVKRIYSMITGLGRVYSSKNIKTKILSCILKILYKVSFKMSDKIIFQNKEDLDFFVQEGYLSSDKAFKVDGSGVNMKKFQLKPLPSELNFVMVSRIIKEKGVLNYLEAAKEIKKKYPNVRFTLLGGFDSSLGSLTSNDIKPYTEQGIIEFPGESNDVRPFLENARFFVLPTFYKEGLPRTILEAMAIGRPIITTDWAGCREAVNNLQNGLLVRPNDTKDLIEKIEYMIINKEIAEKMAIESYNLCKEKFEVNYINEKMYQIFDL